MRTLATAILSISAASAWALVPQSQPAALVPASHPGATPAAVPFASGGLVQTFPVPFGVPIHVQIGGGGPMGGSYVAQEIVAPGFDAFLVAGVKVKTRRCWVVTFESTTDPGVAGGVTVQRDIDPNTSAVTWSAQAAVGRNGAGAFSGRVWPGYPNGLGMPFQLFGADFDCTGGSPFVGNPEFGGGGNISVTVSP